MMALDAPAAAITEMERNMRINEDVIRVLTIRVDALEEGPSVMMNQNKREESAVEGEGSDLATVA
jgi:small subunit ribosomal protein S6